jgi:hypothetical protein
MLLLRRAMVPDGSRRFGFGPGGQVEGDGTEDQDAVDRQQRVDEEPDRDFLFMIQWA